MLIFKTIKTYIKYLTTIYEMAFTIYIYFIWQYIIFFILTRNETQAHK